MAGFLMVAQRWDEARAICPDLREETSDDPECLGYRGVLGVKVDGTEEAARIFDLAGTVKGPYSFGVEKLRQARIAAARGHREQAVLLLRGALSEGISFADLHADFFLEPLSDCVPLRGLFTPSG
jgi:hypothetical protein